MSTATITTVADNLHLVSARDVNWIVATDGSDVTVIDSGYPGYFDQVVRSLEVLGHVPGDVRAILLTHAHIDHLGGALRFAAEFGTEVLSSPSEVGHARRDHLEQATPVDVVCNLWRRGAPAWTARIISAGGLDKAGIPTARAFAASSGAALDVPGAPVPVPTAGHTSGHTAYLFPALGVVATGDALITGHALSADVGPQLVPAFFAHDRAGEIAALSQLAGLPADTVLPGHGAVHRGPLAAAVDRAREKA